MSTGWDDGESGVRRRADRPLRAAPTPAALPSAPRRPSAAAPAGWSILGLLAVGVVLAVVVLTGPADLTVPARLFVFVTTVAFCTYLIRDHRHRLAKRHRLVMVRACAAALLVLAVVLVATAI